MNFWLFTYYFWCIHEIFVKLHAFRNSRYPQNKNIETVVDSHESWLALLKSKFVIKILQLLMYSYRCTLGSLVRSVLLPKANPFRIFPLFVLLNIQRNGFISIKWTSRRSNFVYLFVDDQCECFSVSGRWSDSGKLFFQILRIF